VCQLEKPGVPEKKQKLMAPDNLVTYVLDQQLKTEEVDQDLRHEQSVLKGEPYAADWENAFACQ
jgi:hypothetical protein